MAIRAKRSDDIEAYAWEITASDDCCEGVAPTADQKRRQAMTDGALYIERSFCLFSAHQLHLQQLSKSLLL